MTTSKGAGKTGPPAKFVRAVCRVAPRGSKEDEFSRNCLRQPDVAREIVAQARQIGNSVQPAVENLPGFHGKLTCLPPSENRCPLDFHHSRWNRPGTERSARETACGPLGVFA